MQPRQLLIIRHAKSSHADSTTPDFERRLNQRGVDDGARMGPVFGRELPRPQSVLCSPARRARDTLAFLVPEWVDPRLADYPEALYLAEADALLRWVQAAPRSVDVLLLVGHNPGLTDLINLLQGRAGTALDNLPTLGAAWFKGAGDWSDWTPGSAILEALLRPKQQRSAADGAAS